MKQWHRKDTQSYRMILYAIIFIVLTSSCKEDKRRIFADSRLPVRDNGEWIELKDGDKEGFYMNENDKIYMSFDNGETKDLFTEVDISTFRVCRGSEYAKDKNYVYYPVYLICYEGTAGGGTKVVYYIIDGADPATFKYIGKQFNGSTQHIAHQFAADSTQMYRDGERIEWDNEIIRSKGQRTSYVKYYEGIDGLDSVYRVKYIDR